MGLDGQGQLQPILLLGFARDVLAQLNAVFGQLCVVKGEMVRFISLACPPLLFFLVAQARNFKIEIRLSSWKTSLMDIPSGVSQVPQIECVASRKNYDTRLQFRLWSFDG